MHWLLAISFVTGAGSAGPGGVEVVNPQVGQNRAVDGNSLRQLRHSIGGLLGLLDAVRRSGVQSLPSARLQVCTMVHHPSGEYVHLTPGDGAMLALAWTTEQNPAREAARPPASEGN